uniref:C2H2-type domain-containing protein n=1 Tax=Parastrongyloides trichosuri TaxID=131310 RepID=A0A0N4Z9V5_PARTI
MDEEKEVKIVKAEKLKKLNDLHCKNILDLIGIVKKASPYRKCVICDKAFYSMQQISCIYKHCLMHDELKDAIYKNIPGSLYNEFVRYTKNIKKIESTRGQSKDLIDRSEQEQLFHKQYKTNKIMEPEEIAKTMIRGKLHSNSNSSVYDNKSVNFLNFYDNISFHTEEFVSTSIKVNNVSLKDVVIKQEYIEEEYETSNTNKDNTPYSISSTAGSVHETSIGDNSNNDTVSETSPGASTINDSRLYLTPRESPSRDDPEQRSISVKYFERTSKYGLTEFIGNSQYKCASCSLIYPPNIHLVDIYIHASKHTELKFKLKNNIKLSLYRLVCKKVDKFEQKDLSEDVCKSICSKNNDDLSEMGKQPRRSRKRQRHSEHEPNLEVIRKLRQKPIETDKINLTVVNDGIRSCTKCGITFSFHVSLYDIYKHAFIHTEFHKILLENVKGDILFDMLLKAKREKRREKRREMEETKKLQNSIPPIHL